MNWYIVLDAQQIKEQQIEELKRQGVCDIKPCCCGDCYPCPYERIAEARKRAEKIKKRVIERLARLGVCEEKPCCCGDCYPCPYERIPGLQKIIQEGTV